MIPVLLTILAAYLAAKPSVEGPWQTVAASMNLADRAGNALTNAAERAVEQAVRGHAGQALEKHRAQAIEAGREAGLHELVEVLKAISYPATPVPAGRGSKQLVPGGAITAPPRAVTSTPEILKVPSSPAVPKELRSRITPAELRATALNLAQAIGNTAVNTAATLAGWDKTWHSQLDGRVRSSHAALNGVRISAGESFHTQGGIALRYPHDPKAPLSEVAGCRCWFNVAKPRGTR